MFYLTHARITIYICQLSKFDHVDGAAAYLASDLSDYSRLSAEYQLLSVLQIKLYPRRNHE